MHLKKIYKSIFSSLEPFEAGGCKEAAYSVLVAPSHLPAKVQEHTAPVSTAENSSMVKSLGKKNSSFIIRFSGQFPDSLLNYLVRGILFNGNTL